jgi:hypothetical protein
MQMYSNEELDVMAEAYLLAVEKLPSPSSADVARKLVQEIGWGVANGVRDEDVLARMALERSNIEVRP